MKCLERTLDAFCLYESKLGNKEGEERSQTEFPLR